MPPSPSCRTKRYGPMTTPGVTPDIWYVLVGSSGVPGIVWVPKGNYKIEFSISTNYVRWILQGVDGRPAPHTNGVIGVSVERREGLEAEQGRLLIGRRLLICPTKP